MKKITLTLATALLTGAFATSALAEPQVTERKERQQARIAQGIEHGQLNAREAARLERGEARINRVERADRARDGGRLTAADRAQLNRMQNRESRRIYELKHNARAGARAR